MAAAPSEPPPGAAGDFFEFAPVGLAALDAAGRIAYINRCGARILGSTPRALAGRLLGDRVDAQQLPSFVDHLRTAFDRAGSVVSLRLQVRARDGRPIELLLHSSAPAGHAAGLCLTALIDARGLHCAEQLPRAAVAHAVASDLAQELNQPLGAIMLDAQGCLRMVRGEACRDRLDATLGRLCESAAQAAGVVAQLRRFLHAGEGERRPLDLNALIETALREVDAELRAQKIAVRLELAAALPDALGDAAQIEQVLLHLVRNGIDAMADLPSRQRRLTIRSARYCCDQVGFSVHDSGPGVPARLAPRLFEPLFSTRPHGRGVGLPVSKSLIDAHAGRLWLDADESAGATFHCSLPIAAAVARS